MTRVADPYIEVHFENGARGFAVISWFDGHETKSQTVSLKDDNPFARLTEQTNNAVRFILNELDRRRKQVRMQDQHDL